MNKITSKLLATILVAAIALSAMPAISRAILPAPSFYIVPDTVSFDTSTTSVGHKFNVTIWVATTDPASFTWQCKVLFNTAQLHADRAGYTAGGTSQWLTGHTTIPVTPIINNVTGVVVHGESLSGTDYMGPSSGSLFWVEFEIWSAPTPGTTLTSLIDTNSPDTYVLDTSLGTETGFSKGNCTYSYAWSPPPHPHLEIINYTENTFDMYTHWIGTTFDENIYIKSMNAGWYLTNATVDFKYNGTLLSVTNVVYGALWLGPNSNVNAAGDLTLFVQNPSSNPNGDVLIATVTMMIMTQYEVPPRLYGYYDDSIRQLMSPAPKLYSSYSAVGLIPVDAQPVTKVIRVFAFVHALPPFLSVSTATLGPAPSLGQLFDITVSLNSVVEPVHHLIGIQFRLQYNHTLIQPVNVVEGPYMPYWADQEAAAGHPPAGYPPGTFFQSYINDPDGVFGPHVLVGNMIFPDPNGVWNEPLPSGDGVIATITFRLIYQSFGEPNINTSLTIAWDQLAIGLDDMVSQNIVPVALRPPIPGWVYITTNLPGRQIDLFGGAVNSGYGPLVYPFLATTGTVTGPYPQFPAPFGGQGPNAPMDMVEPQSWVYLHAVVTYNYWPVQHKLVTFEVECFDTNLYPTIRLFAFTDENGVASVGFRMPWPCVNPEALFGVWEVSASCQVADVVIKDDMFFHYDYLVHIWKVTTDKFQYNHGECVLITVSYGTHAMQLYPACLFVSIVDELGVTVGVATFQRWAVGGAVWSQYKNWEWTVNIVVPKWAYAGIATIHTNIVDVEESEIEGALTPEYAGPNIAIQPY